MIGSITMMGMSIALAETGPTMGATPVRTDQLGPPLPVPGQSDPVPWQQRLNWLRQQIRVLGQDPGPNQDIFRQLARQIDAVAAEIPGMAIEIPPATWPTLQRTAPAMATQPGTLISPPAVQQQASVEQQAALSGAGTIQPQASPADQLAAASMGTGGSAGPPQQGQPPPPPGPRPQAHRPGGPPGLPPPPLSEAEQKMQEVLRLSRHLEQMATDPMQVAILAVQAIVDVTKDSPEAGVNALQALLEQEQAVPLRTVIRFALKDLYTKAGQQDAALQQLQAIVRENGRLVGEAEKRPVRPGRMPPPRGGREMPPPPGPGERPSPSEDSGR